MRRSGKQVYLPAPVSSHVHLCEPILMRPEDVLQNLRLLLSQAPGLPARKASSWGQFPRQKCWTLLVFLPMMSPHRPSNSLSFLVIIRSCVIILARNKGTEPKKYPLVRASQYPFCACKNFRRTTLTLSFFLLKVRLFGFAKTGYKRTESMISLSKNIWLKMKIPCWNLKLCVCHRHKI